MTFKLDDRFTAGTIPDINKILKAIRELEKDPAVLAYKALIESLPKYSGNEY